MAVIAESVKTVREITGAAFVECKDALGEAGGDIDSAVALLKKKGVAKGQALADRRGTAGLTQGLIESYIHTAGRVGAMVELNCATDFVARTEEFQSLARDLAMQVAAMNPEFVGEDDVPEDFRGSIKESALLQQPFIKDQSRSVQDLLSESIGKLGENVRVRRFIRYQLAG